MEFGSGVLNAEAPVEADVSLAPFPANRPCSRYILNGDTLPEATVVAGFGTAFSQPPSLGVASARISRRHRVTVLVSALAPRISIPRD